MIDDRYSDPVDDGVSSPDLLPTTADATRYHALDSLRAVMMLLGILLHVCISYTVMPLGEAWPFKDARTSPVFDLTVGIIHVFRMPVFFMMAGFFAALLYTRRGPRGLMLNRLKRILVPFVVGWLVLFPLTGAAFMFAMLRDPTMARYVDPAGLRVEGL